METMSFHESINNFRNLDTIEKGDIETILLTRFRQRIRVQLMPATSWRRMDAVAIL